MSLNTRLSVGFGVIIVSNIVMTWYNYQASISSMLATIALMVYIILINTIE